MTTILLPATVPAIDELDVSVAGGGEPDCGRVTTLVRAAAVTLSDVSSETRAQGVPGEFTGVASDAAGSALAAFGREADVIGAALETATRGLDVYAEQTLELDARRDVLDLDRVALNSDIDALRRSVDAAGAEAAAEVVADLEAQAARLRDRQGDVVERVARLWDDVAEAEDRLIAVLRSVDSDGEARDAADDPGRPDPDALRDRLDGARDDPTRVRSWWETLSPAEREALKIAYPELVGATNGIPTDDRDDVNRGLLEHDLDHLRHLRDSGVELTDEQQRTLDHAGETQKALDDDGLVDTLTGQPVRPYLVAYDPSAFGGDGSGAVAYGNPDTADNTVVLVPGLTSDLSSIDSVGENARNVYEEAQGQGSGETPAVIAWIGYDAPDFSPEGLTDLLRDPTGVAGEGLAEDGGHHLVDFVDGLRATDEGADSHLTVVGHSYGSTTAAHAAADGLAADDLVLIGSPGAGDGVDDASDLGLDPGHVFVGAAENDPVTWLGGDTDVGLGQDPSQESFGGTRFDVAPGEEFGPTDAVEVGFNGTHSDYYDPGSESLENIGSIANGDPPDVVPGRDEPARDHLYDWVRDESGYTWLDDRVDDALETGGDVLDDVGDGLGDAWETGTSWLP